MDKSLTLTLRMPAVLKKRLEREAKYQGVSLNKLANYIINTQLTQLEIVSALEKNLSKKSITNLKEKANLILNRIPARKVTEWDSLE